MHSIVPDLVAAVNIPPNPGGLPGIQAINGLIGGVKVIAISLCVLAVVLGAVAVAIGRQTANTHASDKGKQAIIGGLGAALLIAAVDILVNFATNVGGTV